MLRASVYLLMASFFLTGSRGTAQSARDLTIEEMESEQRVALVIGNGAYENSPLKNPANDARVMSQTLRDCGFRVIEKINANRREMREALREFETQIRQGGVGLFYFAGHGMQVQGRNFLVPIGADVQAENEVEDESIDASLVLRKMEDAGNRLNIVILDACRNNPFARSFRSGTRGLVQMDAATGSILCYATAPGMVAEDGSGDNGLYTSMLLKYIETPGVEIKELFMKVRVDVLEASSEQQVPWESSSLTGSFYFVLDLRENKPPVADAGTDLMVEVGAAVTLDGRRSRDPDGDELVYDWQQVDGPAVMLLNRTSSSPSFIPREEGVYHFNLVVNDGRTDSEAAEVVVQSIQRMQKKEGSKKWVWWLLGAGAVGGATAVVVSSGGDDGEPPPPASIEFDIKVP